MRPRKGRASIKHHVSNQSDIFYAVHAQARQLAFVEVHSSIELNATHHSLQYLNTNQRHTTAKHYLLLSS